MKKIFVAVFGLMLLAAACNKQAQTTTQAVSQTPEIDMTSKGFNPAAVTIKQGATVIFKNTDSEGHWPASNPHPTHTDLPGFDALQPVTPGSTYSYTFTKLGTWGFHDHLNPTTHGSVIVIP
ncbi:MAG: cupredoxin domain-containing protein [Candidatus Doudnabacteria bacterium]